MYIGYTERLDQKTKHHTALNLAIRVALSCPVRIRCRNGKIKYPSIVKLRRRMKIPSVEVLKAISLEKLTWKRRLRYLEMDSNQLSQVRVITKKMELTKIPVTRRLSAPSIEVPCRKHGTHCRKE